MPSIGVLQGIHSHPGSKNPCVVELETIEASSVDYDVIEKAEFKSAKIRGMVEEEYIDSCGLEGTYLVAKFGMRDVAHLLIRRSGDR